LLAEAHINVQGDIGGTGISRFHFQRNDSTAVTPTDCNAVLAALKALYTAANQFPTVLTVSFSPSVQLFDPGSGLIQGYVVASTPPTNLAGVGGSSFGAGLGARINWHTSQILGRRLMRGATYLVPLASGAYASNGGVLPSFQNTVTAACTTYLNALNTATLSAVVWHRPPKKTTSGGITALITAGVVSTVPAGLRSRRV
jgi:hypothetical protein